MLSKQKYVYPLTPAPTIEKFRHHPPPSSPAPLIKLKTEEI
jgi:hypothetical protein